MMNSNNVMPNQDMATGQSGDPRRIGMMLKRYASQMPQGQSQGGSKGGGTQYADSMAPSGQPRNFSTAPGAATGNRFNPATAPGGQPRFKLPKFPGMMPGKRV